MIHKEQSQKDSETSISTILTGEVQSFVTNIK